MRTILSVALAAVVAAVPACTGGASCNTSTGIPLREMPDIDMLVGDTMEIPLTGHFSLPPGCVEAYRAHGRDVVEAMSADPAVAVSIAADLTTLEIAAHESADSVLVTVASVDQAPYGHEFLVWVRAR